jgi:hypothetical protein
MEPTASSEGGVVERAVALALVAIRDHPECFWTRGPQATLSTLEDVLLVVRRLRQHGSVAAWQRAREIELCLQHRFKPPCCERWRRTDREPWRSSMRRVRERR